MCKLSPQKTEQKRANDKVDAHSGILNYIWHRLKKSTTALSLTNVIDLEAAKRQLN